MAFDTSKFKVNKTEGVATVTYNDENAFYEDYVGTKAEVKKVFSHAHRYIEDATSAAAEQATKIMKSDKDIDKVLVEYPYGVSKRGGITVTAKRSQTFRSPADGSEIVKSTIAVAVKDPLTKAAKSKVSALSKAMTESLLS